MRLILYLMGPQIPRLNFAFNFTQKHCGLGKNLSSKLVINRILIIS